MPLEYTILLMIATLFMGMVIGMVLSQKHIPTAILFLLLAAAFIIFIYISQGGHSLRFQ